METVKTIGTFVLKALPIFSLREYPSVTRSSFDGLVSMAIWKRCSDMDHHRIL